MKPVEYKTIESREDCTKSEEWLNNYGHDGWILCQVTKIPHYDYEGDFVCSTYRHIFYRNKES